MELAEQVTLVKIFTYGGFSKPGTEQVRVEIRGGLNRNRDVWWDHMALVETQSSCFLCSIFGYLGSVQLLALVPHARK